LRFRYSAEENGIPVKKAVVYTQDEHKINYNDVDSHAVYITERLQASGYETYLVGGAVRDLILGKKPKDFDIVTAASPPRIKKIFRNARIIGKRFRLVHVFFGAKIIEVSTFRSTKDGHTGNTFGTIEEDVLRRDFSVNALFYDPLKQLVIDYVGGMKDIRKGIIRPLIPLSHIFADDPVRIIRAVKYAALAGFRLPFSLRRMIRKHSSLLAGVSPSRLTEEIFKIIYSPCALEIVEALNKFKIYGYLQPRAVELFNTLPCFKEKYLKSIAALGMEGFKNSSGEALSSLVKDYLEETLDWNGSQNAAELYRNAFILARKFVLPMNPPRIELDHALKIIFAEHGLHVKRVRFSGYHHKKLNNGAAAAVKQD
jgi:poly(A) polymerase